MEFISAATQRVNEYLNARIEPEDTYQGHVVKSIVTEYLRVKTSETARKTLKLSLIAYNLIKSSCQQAGQSAGRDLRRESFMGALDTIVANTSRYLGRQKHVRVIADICADTIKFISAKFVPLRPNRHEPRAQKKRPKTFSYLTLPRSQYREIPHR